MAGWEDNRRLKQGARRQGLHHTTSGLVRFDEGCGRCLCKLGLSLIFGPVSEPQLLLRRYGVSVLAETDPSDL